MRKLKKYKPTKFMARGSYYDKDAADYAVAFIEQLRHTKGEFYNQPFELIDWQERIIRDIFGTMRSDGYRQFNTAYVEIPKKNGKSELAAAIALLLCCGDGEQRAEIYGCAADRGQATIVFDVAADMVRMCPALEKRCKILASQKRILYRLQNRVFLLRGVIGILVYPPSFPAHRVIDGDCRMDGLRLAAVFHRQHMHLAHILTWFPVRILWNLKTLQREHVVAQHCAFASSQRGLQARRHERRLERQRPNREQKPEMQKMLSHQKHLHDNLSSCQLPSVNYLLPTLKGGSARRISRILFTP